VFFDPLGWEVSARDQMCSLRLRVEHLRVRESSRASGKNGGGDDRRSSPRRPFERLCVSDRAAILLACLGGSGSHGHPSTRSSDLVRHPVTS
jgi:hypothetical protein